MRYIAVSIQTLSAILALAMAGELPLTPVATYPPVRPTPIRYGPNPNNQGAPMGQQPPYAGTNTAQSQGQTSVFVLTQVPTKPMSTGTPTNPENCSRVAAYITPKLTPRPTYPPALKSMADKLGGVDRDTCGEMDFQARFRSAGSDELNRFTRARQSTFIVPIWAMVGELWAACGEQARKIPQVAQEPCYRWALELSKSSNTSHDGGAGPKGQGKEDTSKAKQVPDGLSGKFQDLEAGAAAHSSISQMTAVCAVGLLTLLWFVLLA
ncbi:hypothetical protein VTH82DRAFT_6156 [Thermothelomyces myriococcoides]